MRKLVLQMGVSLDGLVAKPGRHGSGGWGLPPEDPALKERKLAWLRDTGLHVMGRVTYEEMVEFWPRSDDAYATPMNDIPKARAPLDQMIEMGDFRKSRRRDRSSRRSWIRRQAALPACAAVGRPFRWSDRREARSRSGSRSVSAEAVELSLSRAARNEVRARAARSGLWWRGGRGRDRLPRRAPGTEPADHIGDVGQPEARDGGRGQARLVALVSDQGDTRVAVAELGIAVRAGGVKAPLEHVARHVDGARDHTVEGALAVGADVDEP
jgi:hypothetical protein